MNTYNVTIKYYDDFYTTRDHYVKSFVVNAISFEKAIVAAHAHIRANRIEAEITAIVKS